VPRATDNDNTTRHKRNPLRPSQENPKQDPAARLLNVDRDSPGSATVRRERRSAVPCAPGSRSGCRSRRCSSRSPRTRAPSRNRTQESAPEAGGRQQDPRLEVDEVVLVERRVVGDVGALPGPLRIDAGLGVAALEGDHPSGADMAQVPLPARSLLPRLRPARKQRGRRRCLPGRFRPRLRRHAPARSTRPLLPLVLPHPPQPMPQPPQPPEHPRETRPGRPPTPRNGGGLHRHLAFGQCPTQRRTPASLDGHRKTLPPSSPYFKAAAIAVCGLKRVQLMRMRSRMPGSCEPRWR
jgi:hypothetical protein